MAHSTVYAWRGRDEQFRAAWNEALEQGYAALEAELVRRSKQSLSVGADEKAAARHAIVDPATALKVLESYRRNGDRRPGEILAGPYDLEEVRMRLEAKMRALGVIEDLATPSPLPVKGGDQGVGARVCAPRELRHDRSTHPQPLPAREGREEG